MRLGVVRGCVVLSVCAPALKGARLVILEPVTTASLLKGNGEGGGKSLVAVDQLGAGVGEIVGFVEGREAANPWWPEMAPVDAYCAIVANKIDYRPPSALTATSAAGDKKPK